MARIQDTPEAKKARRARQQADYDKRATRQIILKLNRNTDADILQILDAQENRQGYIKRLIRDDIARRAAANEIPGDDANEGAPDAGE